MFAQRNRTLLAALALAVLTATACSSHEIEPSAPAASPPQLWQAELAAATAPSGVSPELFAQLKTALAETLARRDSLKAARTPPQGEGNTCNDLTLSGSDAGGWQLEWCYLSTGDYDLNSEVNIADLTPLGLHFGATPLADNWLEAQLADGDGNGEVNIADVTPIGLNYGVTVGSYDIYGANDKNGPWEPVAELPLEAAPGIDGVELVFPLASRDFTYYSVVPCDLKGNEGQMSAISMFQGEDPVATTGTFLPIASSTIGTAGGVLNGPDFGQGAVTVTVPPGALASDVLLTIGDGSGEVMQAGVDQGGHMLYISASDFVRFAEPALIRIPLTAPNEFVSGFRVLSNGGLEPLYPIAMDSQAATFAIEFACPEAPAHAASAQHVARWDYTPGLWFVNEMLTAAYEEEAEKFAFYCGFQPSQDGFDRPMENSSSAGIWLPGIIGQNAFALWYFRNYRSEGPLHSRFNQFAQMMISERATYSVWLAKDQQENDPASSIDDTQKNFALVKNAIRRSNGPVLVLYQDELTLPMYNQFMLAFGYNGDKLMLYSPTRPGESIEGTPLATGHRLFLLSVDKMSMHESFENILLDATADPPFGGSEEATINITSHQPGDLVEAKTTTLQGFIQSGAVLVSQLNVWNSRFPLEQMIQVSVPETGDFSVNLSLEPGENQIFFITQGLVDNFQWHPAPVLEQLPNNLESAGFLLKQGEIPVPGDQLRVDIEWEAYYGSGVPVGETYSEKPLLGITKTDIGTFYVSYLEPGDLTAQPFAKWEDLTTYSGGVATSGRYRITCTQLDPGTYTVMMTAPVLSHNIIKVTSVNLGGAVSGSYPMSYGWAPANHSWTGLTVNIPENTVQVVDQSYEMTF